MQERPEENHAGSPESPEIQEARAELERVVSVAEEAVTSIEAEAAKALEAPGSETPENTGVRERIRNAARNFKEAVGACLRLTVLAGIVLIPTDERIGPLKHEDFNKSVERARIEMETKGITSEQRRAYKFILSESAFEVINPNSMTTPEQLANDLRKMRERLMHGREKDAVHPSREDAWRIYLGLPQESTTFGISSYQPSDSDEKIVYYRINGFFEEWLNYGPSHEDSLRSLIERAQRAGGSFSTYDRQSFIMGNFSFYLGEDAKGSYISYYDKWDLDVPIEREGFIGQPYEIYDRLYYDPVTFEPIFED